MLTLKDITKEYSPLHGDITEALKNVDLSFPDKGLFFITGKSGSGKTTLLNIIAGLDKPSDGTIIIDKKEISEEDYSLDEYRNHTVGYVFQEYNLIKNINIEENIALALELQGREAKQEEIDNILSSLDLSGFNKRMPEELSGGQKQRIAIARAIIKNPKIILADEPTGSLDSKTGEEIFKIFKRLSQDKLVIIVSHETSSAKKYGDGIVRLKDGCVISNTIDSLEEEIMGSENQKTNTGKKGRSKSLLSFKSAFKIGKRYLRRKPFTLILSILFASVSFFLFSLAMTVALYNQTDCINDSMKISGLTYYSIEKSISNPRDNSEDAASLVKSLDDVDITYLESKFPDFSYYPVFEFNKITSYLDDCLYYSDNDIYYNFDYIYGGMEISEDIANDLDLSLVAGDYPEKNEDDNEIDISLYTYGYFHDLGYRNGTSSSSLIEINNYEDIIGKTIILNTKTYVIVGIIDTNFNEEYFESLKTKSSNDPTSTILTQYYYSQIEYGIDAVMFTRVGYYDEVIHPSSYDGSITDASITIKYDKNAGAEEDDKWAYAELSEIVDESYIPDNVIWKDGVELDSLSYNQVILPVSSLPSSHSIYGFSNSVINEWYSRVYDLVEEYAETHLSDLDDRWVYLKTADGYLNYIMFHTSSDSDNIYAPGMNYDYFKEEALSSLLNEDYFSLFTDLELWLTDYCSDTACDQNVEVVGFYYTSDIRGEDSSDAIIVSNDLYNYYDSVYGGNYNSIVIPCSNNNIENKNFINFTLQDNDTSYNICNFVISSLENVDGLFSYWGTIFSIMASICMLLSAFIIGMYVNNSMVREKRDIGILRSIGANKNDIMKIFSFESLLVVSISFILSLAAFLIVKPILTNMIINEYHIIVDILPFKILPFIIIILCGAISIVLSLILPIIKLSKQQPIDVIKDL